MKIIVNGTEHTITTELARVRIRYERLVEMANRDPSRILTVMWATRHGQGSMCPGQECYMEDGMIFNVMDTSNA
jgi:hypothetical protein